MNKQTAIKIGAIVFAVIAIGGLILVLLQFAMLAAFWAALGKGMRAADYVPDYTPPKTLYGCIDRSGKIVLPFTYINLKSFHEGLAASYGTERVRGFNKFVLTGYVDKTGKMVIPQRFLDANSFSEGLAAVRENRAGAQWSYIDKSGQQKIPEGYSRVEDFHNGQAFVERIDDDGSGDYNNRIYRKFIIDKNNQILNENAQALWDQKYDSYGMTEGLKLQKAPNELLGFIDQAGKFVIEPKFEYAFQFKEGFARVQQNSKWGIINKTGKLLIKPQFDEVSDFSEGIAMFKQNEKWGCVDTQGKVIVQPQFSEARDFSQGLAAVCQSEKHWGFIDKNGKLVIPAIYLSAQPFSEDVAVVEKSVAVP